MANESVKATVIINKQKYSAGHQLYNLREDPFEMNNLLDPEKSQTVKIKSVLKSINEYLEHEVLKGFQLPITGPGDTSGKLFTSICQSMDLLYDNKIAFHYDTGRVIKDEDDPHIKYVGTDFCNYDTQRDRDILEQLKIKGQAKNRTHLCDLIDLQLDYGGIF